jgi:hypothetical protein
MQRGALAGEPLVPSEFSAWRNERMRRLSVAKGGFLPLPVLRLNSADCARRAAPGRVQPWSLLRSVCGTSPALRSAAVVDCPRRRQRFSDRGTGAPGGFNRPFAGFDVKIDSEAKWSIGGMVQQA